MGHTTIVRGEGPLVVGEGPVRTGVLATPVAITNTHSVGIVRDPLVRAEIQARTDEEDYWCLPVVAETYDGTLNDINGQHIEVEHVLEALASAGKGHVEEGSVGGGTGMICHEFKGGIGTSSRRLPEEQGGWTVGSRAGELRKPLDAARGRRAGRTRTGY